MLRLRDEVWVVAIVVDGLRCLRGGPGLGALLMTTSCGDAGDRCLLGDLRLSISRAADAFVTATDKVSTTPAAMSCWSEVVCCDVQLGRDWVVERVM